MADSTCPYVLGPRHLRSVSNRLLVLAGFVWMTFAMIGSTLSAQRYFPTATKRAELEAGGGFVFAKPDYSNQRFTGVTGYAALDVSPHFGAEFDFHQVNTHGDDNIYERTYELGPRYVRHYGRFNPYARASYGRGVFNFQNNMANLAYNIVAFAGGVDVRVKTHIYARAEFEGQYWLKFQNKTLQPDVFTLGAAYHF